MCFLLSDALTHLLRILTYYAGRPTARQITREQSLLLISFPTCQTTRKTKQGWKKANLKNNFCTFRLTVGQERSGASGIQRSSENEFSPEKKIFFHVKKCEGRRSHFLSVSIMVYVRKEGVSFVLVCGLFLIQQSKCMWDKMDQVKMGKIGNKFQ